MNEWLPNVADDQRLGTERGVGADLDGDAKASYSFCTWAALGRGRARFFVGFFFAFLFEPESRPSRPSPTSRRYSVGVRVGCVPAAEAECFNRGKRGRTFGSSGYPDGALRHTPIPALRPQRHLFFARLPASALSP